MRVLIFYAKYGGGHFSAANAIKEEIEKEYSDAEIEMVDCMEYVNKVINKLSTRAYTQITKRVPKIWGTVYNHSNKGPIASISKNSNRLFAIKLNSLIKKINPDIIISTHPFSTQMCTFLKKHKKINVKIANVLTDYKSHEQWLVRHEYIDYIFVSNEEMRQNVINHGIPDGKVFAFGIPISGRFSKKYKRQEILKQFNLKENKKIILFFAGGKYGIATKNVYDLLEIFARDFKDIQVVAISGQNDKVFHKFNQIVEQYNSKENIKIIEFTDKVPELMSVSDLVITKPGGITTSESIAMRGSYNCNKPNTRAGRRKCRVS